jgi:hypothetical protein
MRTKRELVTGIAVTALLAWSVGLGCWPVVIWSPLNCSYEDIDISSGRIRRQHYLLGICVHETIVDTALSQFADPDGKRLAPEWRQVNTFSPMVHYSPHHQFHGAIYQAKQIEEFWEIVPFTPAAKREITRTLIFLWHRDGSYLSASRYLAPIEALVEKAVRTRRQAATLIDTRDLPRVDEMERRHRT